MSLNILAKTGTTIQSITVTAVTATTMRMIGYIKAPLTLRLVSRVSRICLLSSTRTWDILPVTSPVRIASSHWRFRKTCGKEAAAAWNVLPEATLAVISDNVVWSLTLSHCVVAIFRAWRSGVPELTRVAS